MEEHVLLPVAEEDGTVVVASGAPVDPTVVDEMAWTFRRRIRLVDAPAAEIQAAIMAAGEERVSELQGSEVEIVADEEDALDDVQALASQAPVIKLVNVMLLEALRSRASDLHLEATAEGLRVRHRIDGVLHDVSRPPRPYQAAVVSRIKIMADLNIAERRVPQDGRIRLRLSEREVDVRVSTLPSIHGESVVLRILDRGTRIPDLEGLGMEPALLESFRQVIRQPNGIVLVTGPTGSGKTTTLYAGLEEVHSPDVKVITVEDPVEYQVEGVTQIAVDPKAGLGFPNALRSILRHDPDILMIGEMRDRETAEIAIQSALTGHLVFSTLHTNLAAATLRAVLAQRLVRVVCDICAEPYEPPMEEVKQAAARRGTSKAKAKASDQFRRGVGCDRCAGTGYRGRTGIYELMHVDDAVRELVATGATLDAIRKEARASGLEPLREDGLRKARAGITTVEEVLRVSRDEGAS
jgi:general secretion pathway protein E